LKSGCDLAPNICLGVPVYNWGPAYLEAIKQTQAGNFKSEFVWGKPDWKDLNNPDTSAVGFVKGPALSEENKKFLEQFIQGLGDGKIELYKGPLNFQDGTAFLKEGETATPQQIWYMPQLLQGIEGPSK
jgi:simple sugar transport system substrate-binding protein